MALAIRRVIRLTVTPAIHHSWILSDGLSDALGEDSVLWEGVSLAFSF